MAELMVLGMWPTISHLLSPKLHSMIRVVRIPHIGTKRKPLTKAGSPNILVHVVATYDTFIIIFYFFFNFFFVLGVLYRHVLRTRTSPDVHARVDTFTV